MNLASVGVTLANVSECLYNFPEAGVLKNFLKGDFFDFFMYDIQHCFICHPMCWRMMDRTYRTVATTTLAGGCSNHSARSHPHSARSHPRFKDFELSLA